MRVLHIIGTLDPESGGPAASVAALNKFRAQGSVNEVVTLDDPGSAFLQLLDFPVTALGPTRTKYGYNSRLVSWLRANGNRFDGVVVHGLWQYCGYAARKVFGRSKPYMVFVHGMLDPYFKRVFPSSTSRSGSTGCPSSTACFATPTASSSPVRKKNASPGRPSGCTNGRATSSHSARVPGRRRG